jgi:integrase
LQLVRHGKGGESRRQPLPARLAYELLKLRDARQPAPTDPVFCGLAGGRLQETILADIIRRAATRAGIEKNVTAHTLRHTAATWLRQERGDTRLVAEYLGHSDLSTVARYAHVERDERFGAADRLEQLANPPKACALAAQLCHAPSRPSARTLGGGPAFPLRLRFTCAIVSGTWHPR